MKPILYRRETTKKQILEILEKALKNLKVYTNKNTIDTCLNTAIEQTIPNKLTNFKIAVSWLETGIIRVKAVSLESAIKQIEDNINGINLPYGEYVDESFKVDVDITKVMAEINKEAN